jgi:hypothetical protein
MIWPPAFVVEAGIPLVVTEPDGRGHVTAAIQLCEEETALVIQRLFAFTRNRFVMRAGVVIGTLTVILFATNPEILSFLLVLNAIGVDVFLLFVSFQLRSQFEVAYRMLLAPLLGRRRRRRRLADH